MTWTQTYRLSDTTYVNNCVTTLESMCKHTFIPANTPFDSNYYPEEDTTELCCPEEQSQYLSILGSVNWCITLGRYDVYFAFNALF